jgi:DNA-binding response OmpR family regulator
VTKDSRTSDRPHAKRLLVVEDDADTRAALEIGLADEYEVVSVADGPAALSMLDLIQFDAMLVDVHLPGPILHEMKAGRLSLPAVFACETPAFGRVVEGSGGACLMKPIRLAALEERLSFVMAGGFDRERPTEPSIEH